MSGSQVETVLHKNRFVYRFTLAEHLTIKSIAALLKEDMTGADLYSICSNAWLSAVRRTITQHKTGKTKNVLFGDYFVRYRFDSKFQENNQLIV